MSKKIKSILSDLENNTDSVKDFLVLAIDINDETGLPERVMVRSQMQPLHILAAVTLLKKQLEIVEESTLDKLHSLGSIKSESNGIDTSEEIKNAILKTKSSNGTFENVRSGRVEYKIEFIAATLDVLLAFAKKHNFSNDLVSRLEENLIVFSKGFTSENMEELERAVHASKFLVTETLMQAAEEGLLDELEILLRNLSKPDDSDIDINDIKI